MEPRVLYKLLKEQIDQRGPINYDNAMSSARDIVRRMEERGEERKKEKVVKSPGTDSTN
jgi:transcriptional regulator of NAD metabolism